MAVVEASWTMLSIQQELSFFSREIPGNYMLLPLKGGSELVEIQVSLPLLCAFLSFPLLTRGWIKIRWQLDWLQKETEVSPQTSWLSDLSRKLPFIFRVQELLIWQVRWIAQFCDCPSAFLSLSPTSPLSPLPPLLSLPDSQRSKTTNSAFYLLI